MGSISVLGKFAHESLEEEMSFASGADLYREFTSIAFFMWNSAPGWQVE
jgi:hypothetical protein